MLRFMIIFEIVKICIKYIFVWRVYFVVKDFLKNVLCNIERNIICRGL